MKITPIIRFKPLVFISIWFLVIQSCNKEKKLQNSGWTPLFNGKNLAGWKHVGEGEHYVEDGLIKSKGGMGQICG